MFTLSSEMGIFFDGNLNLNWELDGLGRRSVFVLELYGGFRLLLPRVKSIHTGEPKQN